MTPGQHLYHEAPCLVRWRGTCVLQLPSLLLLGGVQYMLTPDYVYLRTISENRGLWDLSPAAVVDNQCLCKAETSRPAVTAPRPPSTFFCCPRDTECWHGQLFHLRLWSAQQGILKAACQNISGISSSLLMSSPSYLSLLSWTTHPGKRQPLSSLALHLYCSLLMRNPSHLTT